MTDHRPSSAQESAEPRTRKRFALTGRSHKVDRRVEAARGDLADLRLADRIFAPHYAGAVQRSGAVRSPMLAAHGGKPVSELLEGEAFDVLELSHGYAWGVGGVDGAVGFVAVEALDAPRAVTHVVCAPAAAKPMGTRLTADQAAGFDPGAIRPLDAPVKDFVALAEALVGTPAAPGGRSSDGIDAGGLVALTLSIAGIRAPRFVDLQATSLGHEVSAEAPFLRGDLLFHADSVAIALDGADAVHVDATAVVRTPIAALGSITIRRRLP